jgi:hypothetical protein
LESDPNLVADRDAQHRYNAACAATLTAAGQSRDDPPLDEANRSKLRAQALGWLQAELKTWSKLLESADLQQRDAITQTLQHWQQDPDLASVHEQGRSRACQSPIVPPGKCSGPTSPR